MSTTTPPDTRQDPTLGSGRDWWMLALLVLAAFAVAGLGGLATADNVQGWYAGADKPPYTPPNWVFGPVWTVLYAAMALAAWLAWRRGADLLAWWGQLGLNLLWTPVFFGLQWLWAALVIIVLLDLAVALTLLVFLRRSAVAAALMAPYLLWVLFATALNAGVAWLN